MSALLHACVYVYPEGAWCPQRLEKAVTSPGTGIMDDCEYCVGSESQAQVPCKSHKYSQLQSRLSSLPLCL